MDQPLRSNWLLDPDVHFVNHGSFGACPRPVLDHQQRLRDQLEREPVAFMERELPVHLEDVRAVLGGFLGADPKDLAFVNNATSGVNAVLRSLPFGPQSEIVVTNHAYGACRQALEFVAARSEAQIKLVSIPLTATSDQMLEAVVAAVTDRTELVLIDHVASPTAVIFPVEELVAELNRRDIDTLVDGAHAPGMVRLRLEELGAAYYTGNCHKWMCAPKGAAFLYVRPDRHSSVYPTVISHGYQRANSGESGLHELFDWVGTDDPTALLSVGVAIETIASYHPGGWPGVMKANRELAAAGAALVAEALGTTERTPPAASGSMVAVGLPPGSRDGARWDPLQDRLLFEHGVEVPIVAWPRAPHRLVRISAHLYNDLDDYRALAAALQSLL
ncbi:MAG: aminotransferase class V-fold PLP-dependent enzyme [bacterium]|nr:aminotransferase class V-fold PLP-dependent enzyme [bacterium]